MTENDRSRADDDQPERDAAWSVPEAAGDDGAERRGQVRYQDPESTAPREPTLAEKRARIAAEKRQESERAAEVAAATRKADIRRRAMIGGGVSVGVVALVAAFYSAVEYSNEAYAQQATCSAPDPNNPGKDIEQPEQNCDQEYAKANGGTFNPVTGMWLMPLFLPGGRTAPPPSQYRYSYSPSGSPTAGPGQTLSNPNFTKPPSGTKVTTKSGATVQRGGFGIGNKGGSGS